MPVEDDDWKKDWPFGTMNTSLPRGNPAGVKHGIDPADYERWRANPMIRTEVREELGKIYHKPSKTFNSKDFAARVAISGRCEPTIYYRKMDTAEFEAIQKQQGKGKGKGVPNPFKSTFQYTDTNNYRYWMSSSLPKVQAFGNENATSPDGVILRMIFSADLRSPGNFQVSPHQAPDVQSNRTVVAMHREGFAELGNMNKQSQVDEIVRGDLDHNIGFTERHLDFLAKNFIRYEQV